MGHIFSFAILEAIPDARRGERVNVGMIVFTPDRVDIRTPEAGKLRALHDGNWEDYLAGVRSQLTRIFTPEEAPKEFLRRASAIEDVVRFTDLATFSIERPEQYEDRVKSILTALVTRSKKEAGIKATRINSEIAGAFRTSKVLATPTDVLEDSRKVFRNVTISAEEELEADFLLKNGIYRVTVTLDLRRASVGKAQAALKAIVLNKSSEVLKGGVQKLAVYAAPQDAQQFRPHIGILSDFADDMFNWSDPAQRGRYTRTIYDAIGGAHAFRLAAPSD